MTTKFKVGDKVLVVGGPKLPEGHRGVGKTATVAQVYPSGVAAKHWSLGLVVYLNEEVRKVEKSLEDQLEEAKKLHTAAMEQREKAEVARKETQSLVDRLKQAIAERDKPRGRVKAGDRIPQGTVLYQAHCNGQVYVFKNKNIDAYVAMGNLYYDKESAEQAQHDRKQQILLGDK